MELIKPHLNYIKLNYARLYDETEVSNGNIKCSMKIDRFVGQKQNRNITQDRLGKG